MERSLRIPLYVASAAALALAGSPIQPVVAQDDSSARLNNLLNLQNWLRKKQLIHRKMLMPHATCHNSYDGRKYYLICESV